MGVDFINTKFVNLFGDPDRPIYGNEVVTPVSFNYYEIQECAGAAYQFVRTPFTFEVGQAVTISGACWEIFGEDVAVDTDLVYTDLFNDCAECIASITTPTPTPTITITPTISLTPTLTASVTPTISVTPTLTSSPTPTISVTPTITTSPTPSTTPPAFDPTSIPNIMAWYDGNDNATITEVGGRISEIKDKTSNAFNLTQVVSGNQPLLNTDSFGQYIEFDTGRQDRLTNTSIVGYPSLTAITKFMVFEKSTSASNEEMLFQISSTARIHYYWTNYGSSETFHGFDYPGPRWTGIFSSPQYPNYLNWTYMTKPTPYNFNGELNDLAYNSGPADNWGPVNVDVFSMGARTNGGNATTSKIREVIFYDRELTISEINQVETYLKTKWNYSGW